MRSSKQSNQSSSRTTSTRRFLHDDQMEVIGESDLSTLKREEAAWQKKQRDWISTPRTSRKNKTTTANDEFVIPSPNRRPQTLETLTPIITEVFLGSKNRTVTTTDLNWAILDKVGADTYERGRSAITLTKRRIYDVLCVLRGLGIIEKAGKKSHRWIATINIPATERTDRVHVEMPLYTTPKTQPPSPDWTWIHEDGNEESEEEESVEHDDSPYRNKRPLTDEFKAESPQKKIKIEDVNARPFVLQPLIPQPDVICYEVLSENDDPVFKASGNQWPTEFHEEVHSWQPPLDGNIYY